MEATPETLSLEPPGNASPWAELVVQNGRLAGKRWPLIAPFVLIGQAEGCDVRLNVKDVSSQHCALVNAQPPLVRDLGSGCGTLVNGKPVQAVPLQHGDTLSIGPFRFRVELSAAASRTSASLDADALRVQAAAVVAQQAALTEEEIKLQQRRLALEQQEAQLAAHLDDKRRKLVELKQQLREASAQLQTERLRHDALIQETTRRVDNDRCAINDWQAQALTERQRLVKLRRCLKRRFHQHWARERALLARREAEFQAQLALHDKDRAQLQKDREEQFRARLRFNGEIEIARRTVQDERNQLSEASSRWHAEQRRQQAELAARAVQAEQDEADVADLRAALARERSEWEERRLRLEAESEGLELRIRNQRRKLIDQQIALERLQKLTDEAAREPVAAEAAKDALETAAPAPFAERERLLAQAEREVKDRLAALEQQANELADQRLYLAEQCARLLEARNQLQQTSADAAAQLEPLAHALDEREQQLNARETELDHLQSGYQQQLEEVAHQRHQLEAWQARLAARTASWEGNRQRFLAELKAREAQSEHALADLNQVRRRWQQRRRKEVQHVQTRVAVADKLLKECTALRESWKSRVIQLDKELRGLASRAMALEEYRLECLASATDREAGEQKLVKLRLRWAGEFGAAGTALGKQRDEIAALGLKIEEDARTLRGQLERLAQLEAERSRNNADSDIVQHELDKERARIEAALAAHRQEVETYERQIAELNDEVERLARVLIDSGEPPRLTIAQAA
ncbi:MAG: FHA domain-containing protein [Gemmataceae bacterium]